MSTLEQVSNHLENLGFEITREDGSLVRASRAELDLIIAESRAGIKLGHIVHLDPLDKRREEDILERINDFNSRAGVTRCCLQKNNILLFIVSMPLTYEESAFENFFTQFNSDFVVMKEKNINLVNITRNSHILPRQEQLQSFGISEDAILEPEIITSEGENMSTIDQITTHLEFLGYKFQKLVESGGFVATHQTKNTFFFAEKAGGIAFVNFLGINAKGKNNQGEMLKLINAYNEGTIVIKCYISDERLILSAYHPNSYDRSSFGNFIDSFNRDLDFSVSRDLNLVQYLGPSS